MDQSDERPPTDGRRESVAAEADNSISIALQLVALQAERDMAWLDSHIDDASPEAHARRERIRRWATTMQAGVYGLEPRPLAMFRLLSLLDEPEASEDLGWVADHVEAVFSVEHGELGHALRSPAARTTLVTAIAAWRAVRAGEAGASKWPQTAALLELVFPGNVPSDLAGQYRKWARKVDEAEQPYPNASDIDPPGA